MINTVVESQNLCYTSCYTQALHYLSSAVEKGTSRGENTEINPNWTNSVD